MKTQTIFATAAAFVGTMLSTACGEYKPHNSELLNVDHAPIVAGPHAGEKLATILRRTNEKVNWRADQIETELAKVSKPEMSQLLNKNTRDPDFAQKEQQALKVALKALKQ